VPVGPTGAALGCASSAGDGEVEPDAGPAWRIAASYAAVATELGFEDRDFDLRRRAAVATLERRLGDAWTVQLGGGLAIDGDLEHDGRRFEIEPGFVALASGAFRALAGEGDEPFLMFGLTVSASSAPTSEAGTGVEAPLTAFDARFSLLVGKLLAGAIAPYAAVRAFGGPVLWELDGEDVVGGDRNHYQIGAGVLVTAGGLFDAYVEVTPLGERSATLGAAVSF
jgi:hypothetical protein